MMFLFKSRKFLSIVIVLVVIAGLIAGWFIHRTYYREYDPLGRLSELDPASIRADGAQFIQIMTLSCPCNGFSRHHVMELIEQMNASDSNIRSEIWIASYQPVSESVLRDMADSHDIPVSAVKVINPDNYPWIPAVPAALLTNPDGSLAYFGPFSNGIRCDTGNSFVDAIIDRIERHDYVFAQVNAVVDGCFCQWPSQAL